MFCLRDVALDSGWGAGRFRADPTAWAELVGGGDAYLVTYTVLGAFLGLSHLEIDSTFETHTSNPVSK